MDSRQPPTRTRLDQKSTPNSRPEVNTGTFPLKMNRDLYSANIKHNGYPEAFGYDVSESLCSQVGSSEASKSGGSRHRRRND